jgi:decaprenyl-phosphate phosphoribosyltransferase
VPEQLQPIERERATAEAPPLEPVAPEAADGRGPRASARSLPAALLREARPKQWIKNLLVFAAPGAAGVLTQVGALTNALLAFAAFCLVASGTYFLNDARDAEADRAHPRKRHRPVAAGLVSVEVAIGVGALLLACGLAVAAVVSVELLGLLFLYVAITAAYTLFLKQTAVVDIAVVASGFIIRAVAGGLAVGVPISRYFLIVASFGSLFMVAGKRHGEHLDLGPERGSVRATLSEYSREYLRFVWTMSSAVTITAYCLWAFEQSGGPGLPWFELSIVPFVLFVLRYAQLLGSGLGSAPEELVLRDRGLQLSALVWLVAYATGVYLAA